MERKIIDNDVSAIIIGGNHHNPLGVIRSLGRMGVQPYVIITSKLSDSFVLKSKYIRKGWIVKDSDAAIDLLLSQFAGCNTKPVVIACHDAITSTIDQNRDKLAPYFILPGCEKQGALTWLMNKKEMGRHALGCGLNCPPTFVLNEGNFDKQVDIPFPIITKPLESYSGSKSDIQVCKTYEELKLFLSNAHGHDFLVQKFIDKEIEFQLIGCSLRAGEEVIIPGMSIILRQPSDTNTGFLHYIAIEPSFDDTVERSKRFIRSIGYSGLFSVEFLRDKRGVDYFMEINFRNDGNSIAVTNSGINLPYIWYLNGIGEEFSQYIKPIHDEYVMPEFAELSLFEQGEISYKQWRGDMSKATSYMDYALDDPAPTEGWCMYRKRKIKAIAKHIINIVKHL